jgi:hypothetical protein
MQAFKPYLDIASSIYWRVGFTNIVFLGLTGATVVA